MKKNTIIIAVFIVFTFCRFTTTAIATEIKQGDKVKITTPGIKARLCQYPSCGEEQQITRIPVNTILSIESIKDVHSGNMSVKWFEVKYKKNRGWISIYDTDKQ